MSELNKVYCGECGRYRGGWKCELTKSRDTWIGKITLHLDAEERNRNNDCPNFIQTVSFWQRIMEMVKGK